MADQTDAKEAEEDLKTDHAAKTAAKEEDVALVKATLEANLTRQGLLRWRASMSTSRKRKRHCWPTRS